MNRRQFLWSTTALVASSLVSKFVGAQTADPKSITSTAPLTAPVKIEGNIGYNAGWVIPLEDQKALLELEAQKRKLPRPKTLVLSQPLLLLQLQQLQRLVASQRKKPGVKRLKAGWIQLSLGFKGIPAYSAWTRHSVRTPSTFAPFHLHFLSLAPVDQHPRLL